MKKTYMFKKAMGAWEVGKAYDLDEAQGKDLVASGVAEEVVEDPVKAAVREASAELGVAMKVAAAEAIKSALKEAATLTLPDVRVGETLDGTDPRGGFKSFSHFAGDIYRAGKGFQSASPFLKKWLDDSVKAASGMNEAVDSEGAALVPQEFRATLLQNALEVSIIRPRALIIPMATNSISIPCINETTHAGSFFGGVAAKKPAEAGQKTGTKPAVGKVTLTLNKLVGLTYVTDELLEDSPISLEPLLVSIFGQTIAFQADDDYINGSGAGEPLGILHSPAIIGVAKESNQTNLTIVLANVLKMWARMYPAGQGNAIWMANNDCFPQLAQMTIGSYTAAWMPARGVADPPMGTLLGRPLYLTEKCQTLGYPGDILLVDPTQYLIGQKGGGTPTMATSIHLRFDYDETAFRFVLRHDGQGWWSSAVTPAHSADTLSPFVSLAARHA